MAPEVAQILNIALIVQFALVVTVALLGIILSRTSRHSGDDGTEPPLGEARS